ncbi:GGDEF domain-containing protein [Jeongeupia wiesaeckerbachi]|uniref:GGDEF domain-containing protein n=1 Tax=Jeongeupia wiesaeckerbachi TaxID=3051218 RepID=UPI003D807281
MRLLRLFAGTPNRLALTLTALYVLCGYGSVFLARLAAGPLPVLEFAAGAGLICLLLGGRRGYVSVWLGSVIVQLPQLAMMLELQSALLLAVLLALVSVTEAHLARIGWRNSEMRIRHPLLREPRELAHFWLYVAMLPPLLTQPLQLLLLNLAGIGSERSLIETGWYLMMLILGHASGLFLLGPCYAGWRDRGRWPRLNSLPWWWIAAFVAVLACAFLVYRHTLMLVLPLLLVMAIQHGLPGTGLAMLMLALASVTATARGLGIFAGGMPGLSFLNLQVFLFSTGFMLHYLALAQSLLLRHRMRLEAEVIARTEALAASNAKLAELATIDALTGVRNRREWLRRATEQLLQARRYPAPLSVLVLDLDHFKLINDRHGHHAGDLALCAACDACTAALRVSDSFGRWGGEEFAVLLPATSEEESRRVAEKLRQTIAAIRIPLDTGAVIRITVSIGMASLRDDDHDLERLIRRADDALYRAKRGGRDCVVCDNGDG